MLSQEEQINHIKSYQENENLVSLQEIINSNLKVIRKMAKSFLCKNFNLSYEDLVSAGYEGVILAVKKFNFHKNNAFLPYAKLWIKVKMQEYVKSVCSSVTISGRNGRKLFSNYFRYVYELENKGISNNIENISKHAKVSENEVTDFVHALFPTSSLYYDYENNEEERFATSSANPEKELEKYQAYTFFNNAIVDFVSKLSENEKSVWNNRCYNVEPEKMNSLSIKTGLTPQKISLLEKNMLKRFKRKILTSPMKDLFRSILE